MFKHILVPTDGSELSKVAVEKAVAFAGSIGARITFFFALPEPPLPASGFGDDTRYDPERPKRFLEEAKEQAKGIVGPALEEAKQAGVTADVAYIPGASPHEAIIRAAQEGECDLIFMASRGRSGLNALLLGSETHKVLNLCKIPVLVYR
ncbi:MAG TPA: universal stress protein [Burkholderiales bacterium]